MDDSNGVRSELKDRCAQEVNMMSHPAMVVSEIIPDDVSCDSDGERHENAQRSTDGMGNQGLENIPVAVGEQLECGRPHEIEYREDEEAGWNAKEKSFYRMMSKRAEVESAEKIAEVGADTTRDECGEGEVTGTKAFEGKDGGGVS